MNTENHIERIGTERRFQPILFRERALEDTHIDPAGSEERYEVHHGVKIKDLP